MKVICMSIMVGDTRTNYITVGKIYDIFFEEIHNSELIYHLISDNNVNIWYYAKYFKPIEDFREDQINKIFM